MAIRKLQSLLLALALGVVLIATISREGERGASGVAAASWSSDEEDDDEEDDSDDFDFLSNRLDAVGPTGKCEGQQCAAADGAAVTIESVLVRGLVTKKPKAQDIIKEHFRFATNDKLKGFGGETLGYVTPWNSRGYDFAKLFRNKFTYISPVWLQIREDPKENKPVVAGTHDIDRQWVQDVRGDDGPAIVPRVVYERNKLASTDVPLIISELLTLSEKHAFDGFVFEIPVVEGTMDLLLQMGEAFQEANKLLLLVLNRSTKGGKLPITHEMFQELLPVVHRFSMNAYDYQVPGPNAPLPWLRTTLDALTDAEKEKILLGIPFYGYDNSDAVTGPSYINTLTSQDVKKIRWDASSHECFSEYYAADGGDHHVVFYPCLQFLHDRLQLFVEYGVGAAVWELGQGGFSGDNYDAGLDALQRTLTILFWFYVFVGLDYFYDLL